MTDTTTEAELLSTAAGDADDGGKRNSNRKKRRLSKRERKNLKKQKSSSSTAADGVASTKSSNNSNKKDHDHPKSSSQSSSATKEAFQQHQQQEAPTLEEYMANYIPAPSVKITTPKENNNSSSDSKSLGKWFPKASVIKSSVCYSNDYLAKLAKDKKKQQQQLQQKQQNNINDTSTINEIKEPKASLVLFYQYVNPTWSNAKVSSFLSYLTNIISCHRTNIGGRIRVSHEGVNATVSAASFSTSTNNTTTNNNSNNSNPEFEAAQTLRHFTRDLQNFDSESFMSTDFKYIDGLSADRHFKEMKLLPVKELVFYGIREEDCAATAAASTAAAATNNDKKNEVQGGIHLDAKEYHEMLKRNDAVVIDVRNHYEAAIGRFDGQMGDDDGNSGNSGKEKGEGGGGGGATYIDPKMRKSTDFTSWLAEDETKQKLEGKTVMMFCTGGIRCERASAYLNSQIGNKVNGVYQLKGGIERYLKEFPEGGFWRG
jgi:predicted sulfurtransferase